MSEKGCALFILSMFPYNLNAILIPKQNPSTELPLQNAHLFKTKEQIDAEQWAWIFENLRNYNESSSGITEGQSGGETPGNSTNESSGKQSVISNKGNSYNMTPEKNHSTTTKNPGLKGTPNSIIDILDDEGNIKTRR